MLGNLSETDIRELRVFAKVVEAGGFSAAQIELNISQSTISIHMTALEQRLGMRLCKRGRSGFSLTEKGQLIYLASQRLFAALDEFRSEAGAARDCLIGNLAVGIVDNLINNPSCRLPQVISKMNQLAPEVQISLHVASPSEIERAVLEGRFEVGLGACGRHSPYLIYEDLFDELQVLYCGRGHDLFERSRTVGMSDLRNQQFARRAYSAPERFPTGVKLPSTAVADLMESVAVFVLSGRYIGFLPESFCPPVGSAGCHATVAGTRIGIPQSDLSRDAKYRTKKAGRVGFLHELHLAQGTSVSRSSPARIGRIGRI